jgi:hypothetical protein
MNYITAIARDIRSRLDPNTLPDEPIEDLLRYYAVLALSLGTAVSDRDVHNAWVAWMSGIDSSHPALVPFDELPSEAVSQDHPFVEAIREVARDLNRDQNG